MLLDQYEYNDDEKINGLVDVDRNYKVSKEELRKIISRRY